MHLLRQVNRELNCNVELFYKNKLKTVFIINNKITDCYNNMIKILYFNEIAKIGNVNILKSMLQEM